MAEKSTNPSVRETIVEESAAEAKGTTSATAKYVARAHTAKNGTEPVAGPSNGSQAAASAGESSEGAVGGAAALVKHPLQNLWTLWYYDNEKGKPWEECQHRIATFDTAEDFWCLYNTIKQPTEIPNGNDYSLFKNDIRPMWEDEQNKNGGRWVINLQRAVRNATLDDMWLDVILCVIGEAFEFSEDICGVVINIRPRGPKIAVWTANSIQERVIKIGEKLKESLGLPKTMFINYELHKDTAFKPGGKTTAHVL